MKSTATRDLVRLALLCPVLVLGRPCASVGDAPGPAQRSKAAVAGELFGRLDPTRAELRRVTTLIERGEAEEALDLWRDQVVFRLRERDFGEYGWHDYVLHPRPAGAADYLAGLKARDEYLASGMVGFVDIFGMAGRPGTVEPINWFVDINGPVDWGSDEFTGLDVNARLQRTDYANFEFAKAFVGRYWQTGEAIYLDKAFEIMSDFARHHRDGFWTAYHTEGIGDTEVREIYRCDWRLNTNGLAMGWRLKNFLKIMAGLCKCLSSDKPETWSDTLKPVRGELTREELERVPSDQLAEIAISLMEDHADKLLWFCIGEGAVPNQRAEGLKALAFLSVIFPSFRTKPQLSEYVTRGYEDMLEGNFLPDGGSLEQSFNYNGQDKEGLEELVRFFGDQPPSYAELALEKVGARRAVDDGLQTPLGGLPQVGNSHDVLGKDVWSSDEAAERYWASEAIRGKQPLRPQEYTSKAFRYSGFFAMRGGWDMKDLYLFFMAGRPQRGHSMRDNNAIQMTAYGRQLVVCGGSPTYGNYRSEEARGADFYLSEASSLKNNTVLVDGHSQSKNAPRATRAYETPVPSRWHTSGRYDLVDGHYDLGYGEFEARRDVNIVMSVEHSRQVTFVKDACLWVIQDRMLNTDGARHGYAEVWNFLPHQDDPAWEQTIAGFREDQFELDETGGRFRTTDPSGPNVEFRHFGPRRLTYRKYFGHRDPWLGWFAAGIGDARPAVDVHVNWDSSDADVLITLMVPLDTGQDSPVAEASSFQPEGGEATGVEAVLQDGGRLRYLAAADPEVLDLKPVRAVGRSLLVYSGPGDELSGIVVGCRELTIDGRPVTCEAEDFEFVVGDDGVELTPFATPEAPVTGGIAQGTRPWPLREADLPLDTALTAGLNHHLYRFEQSIRLYDLMLQEPAESGTCDDWRLDRWQDERDFGLKWQGYLRIMRDGMYRFYCHSPTGARVFLYNPDRDLQVPPVVSANYRAADGEGRAALGAGFHQLQIHYMQAWNNLNKLTLEVEGPGVPRQELPADWLFRDAR